MAIEFYIAEVGLFDEDGNLKIDGVVHYTNKDGSEYHDDNDNQLDTWEVRFNIPGITSNLETLPRAIPLYPHVAQPKNGDKILVIRFNSNLDEYGYLPLDISKQVQFRNGNTLIDLTNKSEVQIGFIDDYLSDDQRYYDKLVFDKNGINIYKYNTSNVDDNIGKQSKDDQILTSHIEISDQSLNLIKYKNDKDNQIVREELSISQNGTEYIRKDDNGDDKFIFNVADNSFESELRNTQGSISKITRNTTSTVIEQYSSGDIRNSLTLNANGSINLEVSDGENQGISIKNTKASVNIGTNGNISIAGASGQNIDVTNQVGTINMDSSGTVTINNHLRVIAL